MLQLQRWPALSAEVFVNSSQSPYGAILPDDLDGARFLQVAQHPWYRGVAALQDQIAVSTTRFWSERNVRTLHLPITTSSISSPMGRGSDSSPVAIEMFGVATHLADSMQFGLEYACRIHEDGAWYIMPSFRGEVPDSTHLSQFYHSEVELPLMLEDCMSVAEAYVRELSKDILSTHKALVTEMAGTSRHISMVLDTEFQRFSFDEAADELAYDPRWIDSSHGAWRTLTRAGELELLRRTQTPTWVTHWDHLAVPFYQAFDERDTTKACNADLLLGLGEVIGLGQRHLTAENVHKAIALHEVDAEPYRWYAHLHSQLPRQTSGFGMGIERFLAWVVNHHDIRDVQSCRAITAWR